MSESDSLRDSESQIQGNRDQSLILKVETQTSPLSLSLSDSQKLTQTLRDSDFRESDRVDLES